MNNKIERIGKFTSSEIVALTTNGKAKGTLGKPAYTYIDEKNWERRTGRSIKSDVTARPLSWGKLLEKRVFDKLPLSYDYTPKETRMNEGWDCWAGSVDNIKHDAGLTACDIKCPVTLKSYYRIADCLNFADPIQQLRDTHDDGEKYYWQIVSNAIINKCKYGELIAYCPYKSELEEIRSLAFNWEGDDQKNYLWIYGATDDELPWLMDDGFYKNISIIRFEIPKDDIEFLTSRVSLASNELEPYWVGLNVIK